MRQLVYWHSMINQGAHRGINPGQAHRESERQMYTTGRIIL